MWDSLCHSLLTTSLLTWAVHDSDAVSCSSPNPYNGRTSARLTARGGGLPTVSYSASEVLLTSRNRWPAAADGTSRSVTRVAGHPRAPDTTSSSTCPRGYRESGLCRRCPAQSSPSAARMSRGGRDHDQQADRFRPFVPPRVIGAALDEQVTRLEPHFVLVGQEDDLVVEDVAIRHPGRPVKPDAVGQVRFRVGRRRQRCDEEAVSPVARLKSDRRSPSGAGPSG